MILGAVAAMVQKNIKRLMAYSSIGHIGYALAGVATGVISGYESAIVYIAIYVVMNLGAFSCLYLLKKDGDYKDGAGEYLENAYLQLKTESKNIKNKKDRNKFLKTKFHQKIVDTFKQS